MDIKTAIEKAGGYSAVATAYNNSMPDKDRHISKQHVYGWAVKGKLPDSEWTGKTSYAGVICSLIGDIHPLELCPGAGQYMNQPQEKAA